MAATAFSVTSGATFAVGATGKTILNLIAGAADFPTITQFEVSFDATSVLAPVLVELCSSTQGAAGTPGSIGTVKQIRGYPAVSAAVTVAGQYSAEPTTLTAIKQWWVQPFGGLLLVQSPLGREVVGQVTAATDMKGVCWRVSATSGTPNARMSVEWEE